MIPISQIKRENGISMALVILCSRTYFKTAEIDDLNTFIKTNSIEWSDVFKTCRKHQINPLIYKALLKCKLDEDIQKQINNQLNKFTLQSFEQAKETERLIFLLKENNIKVIPYKGTAFSKQFFGNISMRQSSDIDLVIHPNDIPKAIKILENDGFIAYQKKYYTWIGHEKFIEKHKDFSFDKYMGTKRIHHIELHFNIISKTTHLPGISNTFDINKNTNYQLFQKEIDSLNPIPHFKAVVLHHMLMDNMGYLKTVVDITQILLKIEPLEKNLQDQSILNELEKYYNFDLMYQIIEELIGISFEKKQTIKRENSSIKRILNSSYRKVRENKYPLFSAISYNYKQLKFTSKFYNKTTDKIAFIMKNIISISHPQPEDYMSIKLDTKLYFLYYIIRPFRLLFAPGTQI